MRVLILMALAVAVAGCGGGGSAPPAVSVADVNLTVPYQAAIASLVQTGYSHSFTISGTVDNSTLATPAPLVAITGTGTLTTSPAAPATISGVPGVVSTTTVVGSITANGVSNPISSSGQTYYRLPDYTIAGTVIGTQTQNYSSYSYPSTVKVGAAGPLGTSTDGASVIPTTSTTNYSVGADSVNSLLITEIKTIDRGPAGTDRALNVYRITTAGKISLVSITTTSLFLGKIFKTVIFTF